MKTITYSQVQELVKQLPEEKLPAAYRLLLQFTDQEADTLAPQLAFLRLPPSDRRRILAQQAEALKLHYEQTANERSEWQAGDFLDEDSAG